ncbi:MAG: response regulator [Xanthobacteraceae bacterium]|nr:response regulator [Xanthobacteraceae bacterium]
MALAANRSTPWTFVLDEPTRILVVDDDPILREFASVYLATPYTSIDTACDGAEARTRLSQASYDIIVLDIEMPQLDGLSLLHEIRADQKLRHLPVIMLTGHDDIASIDRAYHTGANSFATKPVNWRQLSYQIRYVLRTTRLESLQEDGGNAPSEGRVVAPAAERDVRDFLQTIVHRVNSIEASLSVLDRARWSEPLDEIRSIAIQALAAYAGQVPMAMVDGAPQTTALP